MVGGTRSGVSHTYDERTQTVTDQCPKAQNARALAQAIDTLGISVVEASRMLDVSRDTVHTWLRGGGATPNSAPKKLATVMSSRVSRVLEASDTPDSTD